MRKQRLKDTATDLLIIGSGVAGLSLALKASSFSSVLIITKKSRMESNTYYAQGGIAAVLSPADSFEDHINDTLICGDGLCNKSVVEKVIRTAPKCINELVEMGANFNRTKEGFFDLGIEGGHSKRRIIHADDLTGREVQQTLLKAVDEQPSITILENHHAINLVIKNNRCLGCYVLDNNNSTIRNFAAKITVLTTGGIGHIFSHTTNPKVATGDGIAMAYRAGATIMNMEFTQFHPTTLYHPLAEGFLISEALRGEGAFLVDSKGRRFMKDYHPMMELAPRDIVARAIDNELKKSGENFVFLFATSMNKQYVKTRFPEIYEKCLSLGIDITKEAIPVVPAAHYCCGGIKATLEGETDIKNLFAIGEVACTGLHGANRLASNSIIEGLVCAKFAAKKFESALKKGITLSSFPRWEPGEAIDIDENVIITHNRDEIQRLMWNYIGVVRSNKRLTRAKNRITLLKREINQYYWDFIITEKLVELRNIALVAELILDSAINRKESRGIHYSLDYPKKLPFIRNSYLKRKKS
jgi:L-aspartate oxidase